MVKWFLCQNEDVEGPFATEEIQQRLESGQINDSFLIWGSPQNTWKKLSWWVEELPNMLKDIAPSKEEKTWHFVYNEVSHGPLKLEEIVESLNEIGEKKDIFVWSRGMPSWVPLYEAEELIEAIGISRREHPRANIDGSVVIEIDKVEHIGVLKTISAGGCGIFGIEGLEVGNLIHVSMRSGSFHKNLNATAEVRYITAKGFVGLKFQSINMEEKAAIINYVKSTFSKVKKQQAA